MNGKTCYSFLTRKAVDWLEVHGFFRSMTVFPLPSSLNNGQPANVALLPCFICFHNTCTCIQLYSPTPHVNRARVRATPYSANSNLSLLDSASEESVSIFEACALHLVMFKRLSSAILSLLKEHLFGVLISCTPHKCNVQKIL